ncbi:FAD-binding oxidoreductase [Microbacterium sp. ASV49]|uniref:FAD-binding oxidoreductase n=1 Tax=Microbacterium candidum TaxID=3041922 RepID=A0ABT7N109_9MICO|nr:FAD-binding oxidoreductase [Microbacterium sp. ASV49]MDL9980395.1 FAD-binding oxidoreductase [Microbacterium sp. ASV49]
MAATTPPELPAVPETRPRMTWDAWGTDEDVRRLPAAARFLAARMLRGEPHPVPRIPSPRVSPSRLSVDDLTALRSAAAATTDDAARALHLGGKSTPDLLARRDPGTQQAPDAVVSPATHDEVAAVLAICDARGIAVVPFGGGTSVVGGVEPATGTHRAVIALDLEGTAGLLRFDGTSLLATFGAGTTGPQAEELLAAHGCTLGHFPQSFRYASIGGFAATRSSGQASRGYGRFDDLVHGMRFASPVGDLDLDRAPASAAGPDLRQLVLGSEGAFGVITEVTVRVHRLPKATLYGAWTFKSFADGAEAVRALTQRGIRPTVLRLSDATETRVNAALGGHVARMRGCLAVATFEGASKREAKAARDATAAVFAKHRGKDRGEAAARSWERGRFAAPALRDALLDIGVLAETLETAATWTDLAGLKDAVTVALTEALADTKPIVLCHISHVYPAGASLYFTVVAALTADPAAQWARAKDAASRAIVAAGGTITHHHAVGRDHRPYLEDEIGPLGVHVLQAVKATLDPNGIMNPGALVAVPERRPSADDEILA